MITEDYVSFEIAKLLREKGFDWETCAYWDLTTETHTQKIGIEPTPRNWNYKWKVFILPMSAPTLQMAMKWLRKVYNIHFHIEPYTFPENINCKVFYSVEIQQLVTDDKGTLYKGELEVKHYINDIESYEQACETAILYCLENLI